VATPSPSDRPAAKLTMTLNASAPSGRPFMVSVVNIAADPSM
jgi:hypothetical protein